MILLGRMYPLAERLTRRALSTAVVGLCLLALAPGCNTGDLLEKAPVPIAFGVTSGFTPDADPNLPQNQCPAATDSISLQRSASSGSLVAIDIVLTDCDGSLPASGLGFEIVFDDSVISFVGCSAGTFFPQNQLAPQTPACSESGGRIVGTIGLTPPNSVIVGGNGKGTLVQLTFNVRRSGVSTPVAFEPATLDSAQGTSLWYIDTTPTLTFYTLGGGAYAGGTFVSN